MEIGVLTIWQVGHVLPLEVKRLNDKKVEKMLWIS